METISGISAVEHGFEDLRILLREEWDIRVGNKEIEK